MPQGSLYIELYNPSSNMEPGPRELYDAPNGGVDLTAYAQELATLTQPDGSEQITGGFTAWPVWRLLIVPDTQATADPDGPSGFTPDNQFARAVYFVDLTQAQVDAAETDGLDDGCGSGASGFRRFGPDYLDTDVVVPPIMPGQYVVIGPGEKDTGPTPPEYVTYIGTLDNTDSTTQPFSDPTDDNQTRQIRLRSGYSTDGSPVRVNPSGIEPAGALNGEAIQPVAGIPINYPNRLSISEATQADPYPAYPPGSPPGSQECYGDAVSTNTAKDLPLDLDSTLETGITAAVLQAKRTTGTTAQVCVVHLQRLANPLQGYDANANPYRTIDSASIDLTAFTGWWGNTTQQQDDSSCAGMNGTSAMMFSSSQRGEDNPGTYPQDQMYLGINPWVQRLEPRNATDYPSIAENPQTHFFVDFDVSPPVPRALQHSLGFLNEPFWALRDDGNGSTIGPYEGFPETRPNLPTASNPARPPFPWLTWNNRPFISQVELMMVPRSSSSRLLNAGIVDPAGTLNVDYFTMNLGSSPYTNETNPFQHLWNFFYSPPGPPPVGAVTSTQTHRLLDLVHVPSRFAGTELQGNPAAFTISGETHPFPPPFSDIPNYREPGRVNINTIFSQDVWNGVMNYFPTGNPNVDAAYWDRMVANRQGYTPTSGNLNENSPTQFANPFRSYAGRDAVPLSALYTGMQQEVNGSMLRSDLISGTCQPLFVHGGTGLLLPPPPGVPLDLCVHPDRNAYFRYQALQKLGNVITTRSNVYAVWITVGYFEVSEAYNVALLPAAQFQGMFPEGYQLGPELGSDTGEVKRHRAFYVFDRSIPVGFERGRNNNVEEAVLLQRFIE
ncbi:hypothetical protein HQ590_05365 [bacterium]|nr:hypothetical protein [bacterium]